MPHDDDLLLVFTMGRVGSSSTFHALTPVRSGVFHLHYLAPASLANWTHRLESASRNMRDSHRAVEAMAAASGRVGVVTLVRDAIERDLSAAYTVWRRVTPSEDWDSTLGDAEAMANYWAKAKRDVALRWFDEQMKPGLGIDVYRHEFPPSGVLAFSEGRFDVLVLRSDLADAEKETVLSDFTGAPVTIEVKNSNQQATEAIRAAYARFQKTAPLSEEYVRSVARSRYMRHFFDIDEDAYVARWITQ